MLPRLTDQITSRTGFYVEAELTPDMGKAHGVEGAPVLSQLPQCDQARLCEERTGQAPRAIWAELDQPALKQAPNSRRQFRLPCVRPGAPRALGNAVCDGRVRREVHRWPVGNFSWGMVWRLSRARSSELQGCRQPSPAFPYGCDCPAGTRRKGWYDRT